MQVVCVMKFGSHLYGTNTPTSDTDIKGVYIPEARDIILGREKDVITQKRTKEHGEKNTSEDTDIEYYSLKKYLHLLAVGNPIALDMLFAPESMHLQPPSFVWSTVRYYKFHFLSRNAAAFLGYCKQQANKYGIKGSRVAAARSALHFIIEQTKSLHLSEGTDKLERLSSRLVEFVEKTEHCAITKKTMSNGTEISHLDVCGRLAPFTATIKNARMLFQHLFDDYGARALQAETNENVDWKALSHAIRVGYEAIELLTSGHITLPLPESIRDKVMATKLGQRPYKEVAEEIENLLVLVEEATKDSFLLEKPKFETIDKVVYEAYLQTIAQQNLRGNK